MLEFEHFGILTCSHAIGYGYLRFQRIIMTFQDFNNLDQEQSGIFMS